MVLKNQYKGIAGLVRLACGVAVHSILRSAATSAVDLHVRCFVLSAFATFLRVWTPSAFASAVKESLSMAAKSGSGIPPGNPWLRSRIIRLRTAKAGKSSASSPLLQVKVQVCLLQASQCKRWKSLTKSGDQARGNSSKERIQRHSPCA